MYSCVKAGNSALTCYCKGYLQKTRVIDSAMTREVNGWTIKLFFREMQWESIAQVVDSTNYTPELGRYESEKRVDAAHRSGSLVRTVEGPRPD